MKYIHIPIYFYTLHKFVTLTAYVMFVNGVDFMNTLSSKIRMFTSEHISTHTDAKISSGGTKCRMYSEYVVCRLGWKNSCMVYC